MKPGFYSLFRRGKFIKEPLFLSSGDLGHQQRERFATSMVAFVLEYEKPFLQHFLERYSCNRYSRDPLDVLIEPDDWGDLVVKNDKRKVAYVFELKLHAALEDKQNPEKEQFWTAGGYGSFIRQKLPGFQVTYTTIENHPSWKRARKDPRLECRPAKWQSLDRAARSQSKLETNLYNTLGNLGVECFNPVIANSMKFGDKAKDAVGVDNCLSTVVDELKKREVTCKKPEPDLETAAETARDSWCYGFLVPSKPESKLGRAIKATVKGDGNGNMAWAGYEGDPARLSVYFYCGKNQGEEVLSRLRKAFSRPNPELANDTVSISCEPMQSKGDFKWFVGVFNAVLR